MPASPLLALIAPASQNLPSSPLSQGLPSKNGALGPLKTSDLASSEAGQGETGLSFFQQLQAASEQSALPVGQELAAFMPQLQTQVSTDDSSFIGPLALVGGEMEEGISPEILYTQPMQSPLLQTVEEVAPQGLSYLESLRRAQPHLQSNTTLTPAEPGTSIETDTYVDSGAALTSPDESKKLGALQTSPLQTTQTQLATDQAVNPNAAILAQGNKTMNLDQLGMEPVADEISLEDLELEPGAMHEAPKTLATAKEIGAANALAQPAGIDMQTLNEAKANFVDITAGAVKDPQSAKSMALEQPVSGQAQATEKSPASFNKLDIPPQHPQWNDQVSKRISIMASESIQSARIQLDPPELGALEVKIKVQHDQVSVSFGSNNQMVRDALDAQTPRLRELLEQQGINLADVNVSEQGAQNGQGRDETLADGFAGDGEMAESDHLDELLTTSLESDSLVDYFA